MLVEMARFVPNSPPQALKIVKSCHFYVIAIQKHTNVTVFSQNDFAKNSKNRILWHFATRPKLQNVKKYFTFENFRLGGGNKTCTFLPE
jgi:hypothetical protein